jgi:GT2 family glycosyltransferase
MDVCVVTYRNDASRIAGALREHDRLHVWDNTDVNLGFAAGANAAASQGHDELVLFVNPDGALVAGALDLLEAAFEDPDVVAAGPSQGEAWDQAGDHDAMEWLSGGCLAVRRAAFQAVGGFDQRLFMYGEDVDLSYKLAAHGRLVRVAAARFDHDTSPRSFRALHRSFRNWLVVQRRHHHADPGRMLRDAVHALRQRRGRDGFARLTALVDYGVRARHWA